MIPISSKDADIDSELNKFNIEIRAAIKNLQKMGVDVMLKATEFAMTHQPSGWLINIHCHCICDIMLFSGADIERALKRIVTRSASIVGAYYRPALQQTSAERLRLLHYLLDDKAAHEGWTELSGQDLVRLASILQGRHLITTLGSYRAWRKRYCRNGEIVAYHDGGSQIAFGFRQHQPRDRLVSEPDTCIGFTRKGGQLRPIIKNPSHDPVTKNKRDPHDIMMDNNNRSLARQYNVLTAYENARIDPTASVRAAPVLYSLIEYTGGDGIFRPTSPSWRIAGCTSLCPTTRSIYNGRRIGDAAGRILRHRRLSLTNRYTDIRRERPPRPPRKGPSGLFQVLLAPAPTLLSDLQGQRLTSPATAVGEARPVQGSADRPQLRG